MEGYKPNSNKLREEEEKKKAPVEKVTSGKVKKKEKTEFRKFLDSFIQGDVHEIRKYLIFKVLVPHLQKGFLDMLNTGASMLLRGSSNATQQQSSDGVRINRVPYARMYDERDAREQKPWSTRARRYDYDDFIYSSQEDAELVLDEMDRILKDYQIVTVAELYDLSGLTPNPTDSNYGWTTLKNASIEQISDGFIIRLPRPLPIN